ncbi:hypothetical protein PA598K_05469 [Paenibacillus sp. 598K]|uniref:S1 family peptidase n=1 Tax=Paenibacillus sp. 598K TaxID=1117987 RepID=UPI000FFA7B08|nr:S1 family peptidase [Paenibacillus sp. 598K]GBF76951.1 hypothetical protein PA598K_05469 [Paenibacillus sp. 598K]
MKRISYLLLSTVLFFGFSGALSANSFFVNQEESAYNLQHEANLKFRKEFGLEQRMASAKTMTSVMLISPKYGVYLTPQEERELDIRLEKQERIVPNLKRYIEEKYEDKLGMMYIDQSDGGSINIGIDSEEMLSNYDQENVKELFGEVGEINFFEAEASEKELDDLHMKIASDIDILSEEGIKVHYIDTNLKKQIVEVGLENLDEEIERKFKDYYSDRIELKISAPSQPDNRAATYTNLQAGIRINTCTLGFNARSGAANPSYYAITAAHCGSLGTTFMQGSNNIGTVIKRVFSNGVDAMAIGQNTNLTYTRNLYTTVSNGGFFSTRQPLSQTIVGQAVFMSGQASNTVTSGTIVSLNRTVTYPSDGAISNLIAASYSRTGGDSGAPVYNSNMLMGVHSGHVGNDALYSQIERVINQLNGTCSNCFIPILQ